MSETDAIRALMEADRWIDRVTSQRSHLPEIAELASVETELRSLLIALREAEAELAPVRTAYDDAQRESERSTDAPVTCRRRWPVQPPIRVI